MSRISQAICGAVLAIALLPAPSLAQSDATQPAIKEVSIGKGVVLHYLERGKGKSVVFVHGSLSDGGYWSDEVEFFSHSHRVVAYSRRYNFPNANEIRPGYSAITDADDLAALAKKLALGKIDVIGHSYGALTALFLAVRHPEIVRSLVLAEPPAVSLLGHLQGDRAETGRAMLADIESKMVKPMQEAFRRGDREAGIRAFMAYVFQDPLAWDKMPEAARKDTLKNAREWDAILTTGELFPPLEPGAVRHIRAPALLLSGERSYPFLGLIGEELERLLPKARRIVIPGAGHQMWLEKPEVCRQAVLEFWRRWDEKTSDNSSPKGAGGSVGLR